LLAGAFGVGKLRYSLALVAGKLRGHSIVVLSSEKKLFENSIVGFCREIRTHFSCAVLINGEFLTNGEP
jgi:hypothetical protein